MSDVDQRMTMRGPAARPVERERARRDVRAAVRRLQGAPEAPATPPPDVRGVAGRSGIGPRGPSMLRQPPRPIAPAPPRQPAPPPPPDDSVYETRIHVDPPAPPQAAATPRVAEAPARPPRPLRPPTAAEWQPILRGLDDRLGAPRPPRPSPLPPRGQAPPKWTSPTGRFLAERDPIVGPALVRLEHWLQPRPGIGNIAGIFLGIFRSLERLALEPTHTAIAVARLHQSIAMLVQALPVLIRDREQIARLALAPLIQIASDLTEAVALAEKGQEMDCSARVIEATVRVEELIASMAALATATRHAPGALDDLARAGAALRSGSLMRALPVAERLRLHRTRLAAARDGARAGRELRGLAPAPLARQFHNMFDKLDERGDTRTGLVGIFERAVRGRDEESATAMAELAQLERLLQDPQVRRIRVVSLRNSRRTPDFLVQRRTRPDASRRYRNVLVERVEVTTLRGDNVDAGHIASAITRKADDLWQSRNSQLTEPMPGYYAPPEGVIIVNVLAPRAGFAETVKEAIRRAQAALRDAVHLRRIEVQPGSGTPLVFSRDSRGRYSPRGGPGTGP